MKNLLLLLAMLITTSTVFSQLFVRPNPTTSTDSYIYVDDEILFVEQDVNLEANSTGTTEASIYLRNDGQLIQGATPSDNKGSGSLSVYQNAPNDDSWDYTYWCSPIGYPSASVNGNRVFGILRLYDVVDATDSNITTITTSTEGTDSPMSISTKWTYWHPNPGTEAENDYIPIWASAYVQPGFGFIMKGLGTTNHNQNYDFRGRPNNGSFSIPVENNMMTLSGNPYPSAIDLSMVILNNGALNTVWFWDEDRDIDFHTYSANRAGYGTWLPTGGAGTYVPATLKEWDSSGGIGGGATGGFGGAYDRRYSPIGQGFMLIGNSNGNVTIDNSMRVFIKEGNNSDFRNPTRDNGSTIEADDRWPQIRLITVFGESHTREMVLLFNDDSTDGYDHGMDALHPMDATSEAYFPITTNNGEEPFVIQTVPYASEKQIPINFSLDQQMTISLQAVEIVKFNRPTFLWDSLEDTYRSISVNPNDLSPFMTLPAGTYNDRFFIVFKNRRQVLNDSEGTKFINEATANVTFFQNNPYKQMEIANPEGYTIKNATIFDMAGKLVVNQNNLGNATKLTVGTSNLSDGVYLIKLITSENINIDFKMIIKNN